MIPENKIGNFKIKRENGITILWEEKNWWMSSVEIDQKSQNFVVEVAKGRIYIDVCPKVKT